MFDCLLAVLLLINFSFGWCVMHRTWRISPEPTAWSGVGRHAVEMSWESRVGGSSTKSEAFACWKFLGCFPKRELKPPEQPKSIQKPPTRNAIRNHLLDKRGPYSAIHTLHDINRSKPLGPIMSRRLLHSTAMMTVPFSQWSHAFQQWVSIATKW